GGGAGGAADQHSALAGFLRHSLAGSGSPAGGGVASGPRWFHNGSKESAMLNLTLKNIPQDLHAQLKDSAQRNRRSLNSEILARLEREFSAPVVDREARARALR